MEYCRYFGKILFNQSIYHTNAFTHHEKQSVCSFNITTLYKALRMLNCIFSLLFVRLPELHVCFFDILTYLSDPISPMYTKNCNTSPCKYCLLRFMNE